MDNDPMVKAELRYRMRDKVIASIQSLIDVDAVIVTTSSNERSNVCTNPLIDTKLDLLMQ
jgi:hypothetical protein